MRSLPPEGRQQLGPIDRWRWCLLHIRCCIIFGWLVCRGPRTFRTFAYYIYRYWICVRQALGTPVATPPTEEQRHDFQTLVQALAGAYKPYLTDQLASVEFPAGIPDEVLAGKIDCFEGEEEAAAIFERLLTVETAPALLEKRPLMPTAKSRSSGSVAAGVYARSVSAAVWRGHAVSLVWYAACWITSAAFAIASGLWFARS